ncbi:MAG: DUF3693 domain-containing protein [Sedimenticola sp.]
MRDGAYYMKLVRDLPGVGSFNKAGLLLGITGASVSIIRNGGGISEETAIKIGKALDIDPGIVYADINEARAKDSVTRKFWHDISKHLGTAASAAILSTLLTLPSPADASAMKNPVKQSKITYILCKIIVIPKITN